MANLSCIIFFQLVNLPGNIDVKERVVVIFPRQVNEFMTTINTQCRSIFEKHNIGSSDLHLKDTANCLTSQDHILTAQDFVGNSIDKPVLVYILGNYYTYYAIHF